MVKFGIKWSSTFNLKNWEKGLANKPSRDGDALYFLDFSGYLMTEEKVHWGRSKHNWIATLKEEKKLFIIKLFIAKGHITNFLRLPPMGKKQAGENL